MWPADYCYKHIIQNNWTNHNTVTINDINNHGLAIYGQQQPLLSGKMTQPSATPAIFARQPIPIHIKQRFENGIHVEFNIIFVNENVFLQSRSQGINYRSIKQIPSRQGQYIKNTCKRIIQIYERRGLKITDYHGHIEFDIDGLEEHLAAQKHIFTANEHIGGIERQARAIKECAWCACNNTPYRIMPKIMIKSMMEDVVFWLNAFPTKASASRTISPATIIDGSPRPDLSYNRPIFGSYCIAYTTTTNDMRPRAVPSIALKSADGSKRHYFMSLHSGKQIHSKKWTELPIDQEVIDRVEEIGADEGQPEMPLGQPIFEWTPGTNFEDDEYENDNNEDHGESVIIKLKRYMTMPSRTL